MALKRVNEKVNTMDSEGQPRSVLITGPGGIIGCHVAQLYAGTAGVSVVGVSRNTPENLALDKCQHIRADLLDAVATREALSGKAASITHVVFGAYLEGDSLSEQVRLNVDLLRNTLDALNADHAALKHVTLFQGSKAYGNHLGPIKTPTKESDPRLLGPHFYYAQEDHLREMAEERGFRFTILRPDLIVGYSYGTPMNMLMTIAVYASICKELELPLRFPGTRAAYHALIHCTDAELLARATRWAGTSKEAENQIFNVTNGDQFRFEQVWSRVANYFQLDTAPPVPMSLAAHMADKAPVWDRLTKRHGLHPADWRKLVNWSFLDGFTLNENQTDVFGSTIKIRQAGFGDCYDTEDRFVFWFDRLRSMRIIP